MMFSNSREDNQLCSVNEIEELHVPIPGILSSPDPKTLRALQRTVEAKSGDPNVSRTFDSPRAPDRENTDARVAKLCNELERWKADEAEELEILAEKQRRRQMAAMHSPTKPISPKGTPQRMSPVPTTTYVRSARRFEGPAVEQFDFDDSPPMVIYMRKQEDFAAEDDEFDVNDRPCTVCATPRASHRDGQASGVATPSVHRRTGDPAESNPQRRACSNDNGACIVQ